MCCTYTYSTESSTTPSKVCLTWILLKTFVWILHLWKMRWERVCRVVDLLKAEKTSMSPMIIYFASLSLDMYNKSWYYYSWIGRPKRADKELIYQRTRRVTTLLRPPLESSRREESKYAGSIFVKVIFDLFFQNHFQNNAQTKIDPEDPNSPCRELSNGGLKSVVALLVCWQIDYSCASPGKAIQL